MGRLDTDSELGVRELAATAEPYDITTPDMQAPRLDVVLAAMQANWKVHARYLLTRSTWYPETTEDVLGQWLPLDTVKVLADQFNESERLTDPHRSNWGRPFFSYRLHLPEAAKGGIASVGDIVIHEVVEPIGEFTLSDCQTFRRFLLVALVTGADKDGRITSYSDRNGEHCGVPRKHHVVSAAQVNVDAAIAGLVQRERAMNRYCVEFHDVTAALRVLEYFIRHQTPVYPVSAG